MLPSSPTRTRTLSGRNLLRPCLLRETGLSRQYSRCSSEIREALIESTGGKAPASVAGRFSPYRRRLVKGVSLLQPWQLALAVVSRQSEFRRMLVKCPSLGGGIVETCIYADKVSVGLQSNGGRTYLTLRGYTRSTTCAAKSLLTVCPHMAQTFSVWPVNARI